MAGVKLTSEARARVKLVVEFYRRYYPHDTIDRDRVIDWAIANLEPLDCAVVSSRNKYALQHRKCGFVAVRAATMLRHFRECPVSTEWTLDMRAQAGENDAGNGESSVLIQVEQPDAFVSDIDETGQRTGAIGSDVPARGANL